MPYSDPIQAKRWRVSRQLGRDEHSLLPAAPVRKHIRTLLDAGFLIDSIAETAGLSTPALHRILKGAKSDGYQRPAKHVRRATSAAILAVTPERIFAEARDAQRVPSYAMMRRIQALQALGWTLRSLDDRLGIGTPAKSFGVSAYTYASTHRRIVALFEEIKYTPGPSARTAGNARRRGFVTPLSWDNIDDPNEVPKGAELDDDDASRGPCDRLDHLDEVAIDLAIEGKHPTLTRAEAHVAAVRMQARGMSVKSEIPAALGLTERTVCRYLARHRATCTLAANTRQEGRAA